MPGMFERWWNRQTNQVMTSVNIGGEEWLIGAEITQSVAASAEVEEGEKGGSYVPVKFTRVTRPTIAH